ncbi:hypothetical protein BN946_scf184828.g2 [Trametes cinnabarina]|uniref:Uncharacterized protein n=1 Tax=Pycnoporus cinnabarinus TaxID=5643 RepID=A0A060SJH3_PYCCI|nr:hypothetical protein BN946_scf184828.g2 [Trametes cinnabarina]
MSSHSRYTPGRAPYGPPALRIFTQTSPEREPTNAEIATKRFTERLNVRCDQNEQLDLPFKLHEHFCVSSEDRKFAHHEAMADAEDAIIGAGRLADTLFIGFGVRPEWNPRVPLDPANINVQLLTTRQFRQVPGFQAVVAKLEKIVREELVVPHILAFREKLEQIQPGPGYAFDEQSQRIITQPIRLATTPDIGGTSRSWCSPKPAWISKPASPFASVVSPCPHPRARRGPYDTIAQEIIANVAERRRARLQAATRQAPQAVAEYEARIGRELRPTSAGDFGVAAGMDTARPSPPYMRVEQRNSPYLHSVTDNEHAPADDGAWLHTPAGTPPQTPPRASQTDGLLGDSGSGIVQRDVEGSEAANYYTLTSATSFSFSRRVMSFIATRELTVRQCARVALALDYHVEDWVPLFCEAGLDATAAGGLRDIIFEDVPADMRDLMDVVRPLAVADDVDRSLPARAALSMARTRQRPRLTAEQRAIARQRTDLMWKAIQQQREAYNEAITQVAADHSRSEQWVATQLFRGGRDVAQRRKKNLYNAVVHDLAKKHKEAGLPSNGRSTLKDLAREAASMDYENLPEDEKERLLAQLEEDKRDAPVHKVPKKHVGVELDGTLRRVLPEIDGIVQRTGAHYLFMVTRGEVTDNFALRSVSTPKVVEACMQLFKCTPDEMAMKIEAYVTTGLAGVVRAAGTKRHNQLKSEIRNKVYQGLRAILTEKGVPEDEQPSTMKWAHYDELVCRWGVALDGWTEGGNDAVCNPGEFKSISQLERLHAALHGDAPSCYWIVLDEDAWEARKEARRNAVLTGQPKKRGTGNSRRENDVNQPPECSRADKTREWLTTGKAHKRDSNPRPPIGAVVLYTTELLCFVQHDVPLTCAAPAAPTTPAAPATSVALTATAAPITFTAPSIAPVAPVAFGSDATGAGGVGTDGALSGGMGVNGFGGFQGVFGGFGGVASYASFNAGVETFDTMF